MSLGSSNHRRRNRSRQRQRCGARVKNLLKGRAHGVAILRDPFCNAWAMPNGRCRVHGGASTGPKSPDGKARVVAAMVEGRRKWVERRRAEGRRFTAGRKGGDAWVTEAMRERARAEARRLGAGRFTLDHSLTLALLKSAKGDPAVRARAKAMLDAHEQAEADRDRGRGSVGRSRLARVGDRRLVRPRDGPDDSPVRGRRAAERLRPPALRADRIGGRPDHSRRQVAAESLPGARPPRGNNDGESPGPQSAGQASRRQSRWGDNKGVHFSQQKCAEKPLEGRIPDHSKISARIFR